MSWLHIQLIQIAALLSMKRRKNTVQFPPQWRKNISNIAHFSIFTLLRNWWVRPEHLSHGLIISVILLSAWEKAHVWLTSQAPGLQIKQKTLREIPREVRARERQHGREERILRLPVEMWLQSTAGGCWNKKIIILVFPASLSVGRWYYLCLYFSTIHFYTIGWASMNIKPDQCSVHL